MVSNERYYDNRPNYRPIRRERTTARTEKLFKNVCILCGTAIVLALTVKVIMSLFV